MTRIDMLREVVDIAKDLNLRPSVFRGWAFREVLHAWEDLVPGSGWLVTWGCYGSILEMVV